MLQCKNFCVFLIQNNHNFLFKAYALCILIFIINDYTMLIKSLINDSLLFSCKFLLSAVFFTQVLWLTQD